MRRPSIRLWIRGGWHSSTISGSAVGWSDHHACAVAIQLLNLNHGRELPPPERGINDHDKGSACTAGSSAFCFYCDPDFVYSHLGSIPRLCEWNRRNRSPDRTVTRRVRARTVTFSATGRRADASARAWSELRFSVRQRFRVESQERAERDSQVGTDSGGTVDIDFGALTGQHGFYFHATALWQGGGDLGTYLGLLTSPSGMSSANTCRDSWWFEKRWLDERITTRVGRVAGQDFYGAQHYAASFIFEPMGYALGNLVPSEWSGNSSTI